MISKFFIERPRFAFVISILFMLSGIIAICVLPVAQYPTITPPVVSVTASYPGADAKTVMDTVIQPLESQINGAKNMIYMSSTASDSGMAVVNVTFETGTNGDQNTVNTQNRVNWATPLLPQEVQRNGIKVEERSTNMLMVISLSAHDGEYDALTLSNFMSLYVKDQIARVPGVGNVGQFGEMTYSMRIWINPLRLASLRMSVDDVVNAVKSHNVQVSAGALGEAPSSEKQSLRLAISTKGRLETVEEFEKIVVKTNADGSHVKLKDVANIELGSATYSSTSIMNGKPAALLGVYQTADGNGLDISKACREKLSELKQNLFPPGLEYGIPYDTTKFIRASIEEVIKTLVEAVLLVILVTYIFLQDWRATLVPTIAIPVSLVGTFAIMLALGYSINLITLFGLILAIGIVVDDAIVVIENISRLMEEEHLSPKDAALKSMEQVTAPVIATTSVLFAMFIPVCFLPGITGVMYRQFGVTISVAVFISMINALTLSPALSAMILHPVDHNRKKFIFFRWFDTFFGAVTSGYTSVVRSLVRKIALIVFLYCLLGGATYYVYGKLPTGFVPNEDQGAVFASIQLPDAAALSRTEDVMKKVENIIAKTPGVSETLIISGYNFMNGVSASNCGFAIGILKPWSERTAKGMTQHEILQGLYGPLMSIPEAFIMPFEMPSIPGLGSTGGFSFVIQDATGAMTPAELQKALDTVVAEASKSPILTGVYSTFRASTPQIYLEVDREKALKMGVTLDSINTTLQGIFSYIYVNDFNKYGKSYRVEIQAESGSRDELNDISTTYVKNKRGDMVPLGTLVDVQTKFVPQYLSRYNMYPSVTINGSARPGYSSGEAMKEIMSIAKRVLPQGMTFDWTDMSYQERKAGNQTLIVFALALTFIYLFLVAQYESWMIPLAVMLSVPVAFFGALCFLMVLNIENNIYTQVGFVLLFGIACKTAILVVEFAKKQHDDGMDVLGAAEYAARLRFRAVLMTAVSFILGTFPLVVAMGAGALSRRSLGTAVFGGMLISVIIGTFLIPACFVLIQKLVDITRRKPLPVSK